MTKNDFYKALEETNSEIVHMEEAEIPKLDYFIIRSPWAGAVHYRYVQLTIAEIPNIEYQELTEILAGTREVNPLAVITRIVGYYSSTANWNKSKFGELKDRQAGDYEIPTKLKEKAPEMVLVAAD